jgi:hypothetical protein
MNRQEEKLTRALDKFVAANADFDQLYPQGIEIEFDAGTTEQKLVAVLTNDVRKERKRAKEQRTFRDALLERGWTQVGSGWSPPLPSVGEPSEFADADVKRRVRLVRQDDGSAVFEELEV